MGQEAQKRILLADDDPMFSKVLSRILGREGFEVITVDSGEAAYNKAVRQQIDLIILEATLPGIDGYTLCRRLRQNPAVRSLPILMLTSQGDIANKIAGFEAGVDDFLVKPFEAPELVYRAKGLITRAQWSLSPSETHERRSGGEVIAVFGTKGGVGKNVRRREPGRLHTQTFRQACRALRRRFLLWRCGRPSQFCGLRHANHRGVLDLIDQIESRPRGRVEPDLADRVLAAHASGIRALLSLFQPEDAEIITAEHVSRILDFLAQYYDYVVVDCHKRRNPVTVITVKPRSITITSWWIATPATTIAC